MYGNHITRSVRGFQRTYEERALEYRRHIDFLIRERQLYQDQFQDLQPTFADDEQRLSHLDATIRNTISELEQHITDYNEAVDKWRQLAADYEIAEHRDSNDWAQSMYVTIDTFFEQPELYPTPLDAQFAQLISDYRDLLEAVTEIRMDPVRMAGFEREATTPASTPAQETLAAVEQTTSNSSERRTVPGPLSGSARNSPEQQSDPDPLSGNDERSPAPATSHSEGHPRVTINDDVRRHFYTDQSATSYATSRLSLRTIDAYHARASTSSSQPSAATRRGVPIVQQLDFNNNTTPSSTPPRPEVPQRTEDSGTHAATGIMTYADGNVANASPISWRNPRIGTPAEITEHGTDSTAPLAAESPRETFVPRQLTPLPSSPAVPNTNRQKTKSATDAAGGRGASSFFSSGPSRVATSGHHPNTSLLSGQPGPTATAPTTEAHSRLEAARPPIEPFEGNIRRYPAFRNRFLDVIEGHQQMPPRHKLQYLLQFLRGEPYQLANNFQLTDENYYAVINTLEERYGNEDVIRSLLMADLIALRAPSQTMQDLRRFHDEAFRITTDLKQLGDDVDANRLYSETLMAKLSPTVKLELIRNSTYVAEKTISSILSGLQKYTQQLEIAATTGLLWTQLSVGNSCPPPGRRTPTRPGSPHPIKSNRAPYAGYGAEAEDVPKADSRQDRKKCALCDLSHWASKCIIYRSIKKRYNRIKKLGLCFLCLRGDHWVEKCPQRTLGQCRYCDRRTPHHRALCITIASRKTQRSDPVRNYDPGTKPVPGGPSGDGQSAERHAPVKKTVNRSESRQDSTARIVPPSAQRPSGDGNLKRIHRKKRSRSTGTGPQGRNSTSRPTTASTVEDMTTKEVNACDLERRLTAVEAFLTTARCPTNRDSPPYDRPAAGTYESSAHDEDPWWDVRGGEDESEPESIGHCLDAPTEPSDASSEDEERFPPYQDPTAYIVSASLPADTHTVLLECARVTAVNPFNGATRDVTVFFDSGSSLTFVSTALADDLDLPQQGRRRLRVNTFGSKKPMLMEGFATNLVLRSRRGQDVSLHATAAPDCIVKAVTTALVEDHELPPLLQNEVTLISTKETPDILIGQDTAQLFQRHTEMRLPNGFDLIQTILGPMIGGAGRVANPSARRRGFGRRPGANRLA